MKTTPRSPLATAVAAVLAAAVLGPRPAFAWSGNGHETVGYIAQYLLQKGSDEGDAASKAALAGIAELLNPDASPTYALPGNALALLAPCADKVRVEQKEGEYPAVTAGEVVPCGEGGLSFPVEAASKDWHYVNIPVAAPGTLATTSLVADNCPNGDCVVAEIKRAVLDLQTSGDLNDRRKNLMYLVHFVGDEHQPLHCADEIVNGVNDDGGNLKFVRIGGTKLKLHALWDHLFVASDNTNNAGTLSGQLEGQIPADTSAWTQGDFVTQAALDSFSISQNTIYPSYHRLAVAGKIPTYSAADTQQMQNTVIFGQLEKGGVRLAALLKQAFNEKPAPGAAAPAAAPAAPDQTQALENARRRIHTAATADAP